MNQANTIAINANREKPIERKVFQFFVLILAVICFIPGGVSTFGGMNGSSLFGGGPLIFAEDSVLRGFADNQYRFGFGVFLAQGIALLYFLSHIEKHAVIFRFVVLALFVGGLGRLSNIVEFGVVDQQVVGPTVIELVIVPLLLLWHQRIIKATNSAAGK